MLKCEKCEEFFRDSYNLKRHESRKKSCVKKPTPGINDTKNSVSPDSAFTGPNSTDPLPISAGSSSKSSFLSIKESLTEIKAKLKEKEKKCQFCLKVFSNKWNKLKHEKTCNHNNETRNLEIEFGVDVVIPDCKTECRFCNKHFFRTDALKKHVFICKDRRIYHDELLKQHKKPTVKPVEPIVETPIAQNNTINTVNNNTVNNVNNTVNNLIINFHENTIPFGNKRLTDHIKVDKVVEILRAACKQYSPDQDYEIAGELLLKMEEYLQERPENRNYLTDDKSTIWTVKTELGVKYIDKDKCINDIIKENAGILYDKREDIETVNKKVFENKTMLEAFYHEYEFKSKGINHKPCGEKKMNKIKSGLQIINKNVVDF